MHIKDVYSHHITNLSLNNNKLTEFSNQITRYSRLEELDISYNSLKSVPSSLLSKSILLRTLKIDHNPFTTFEVNITRQYEHLTHLFVTDIDHTNNCCQPVWYLITMSYTQMGSIPEWMENITSVSYLFDGIHLKTHILICLKGYIRKQLQEDTKHQVHEWAGICVCTTNVALLTV